MNKTLDSEPLVLSYSFNVLDIANHRLVCVSADREGLGKLVDAKVSIYYRHVVGKKGEQGFVKASQNRSSLPRVGWG